VISKGSNRVQREGRELKRIDLVAPVPPGERRTLFGQGLILFIEVEFEWR